jgi:hypothetical protein
LNFNQTGMIASKDTAAVIMNGACGPTFSHNQPPIIGAGRETNPRLVLNNPKAVPRKWAGTALLISDW